MKVRRTCDVNISKLQENTMKVKILKKLTNIVSTTTVYCKKLKV